MGRVMRRRFLLVLAAGAVMLVGGGVAWRALHTPVAVPAMGAVVFVPPGSSFRAVAERLHRAGVIRCPLLLTAWARYRGLDRSVRRGEYHFSQALSAVQVLDVLQSPSETVRWLTVPEGLTAEQIAALLEEQGFGGSDVFRCVMTDAALLREFDLPATGIEGYLFPDTYALEWTMEPAAIIRAMLARFREESAALAEQRAAAGLTEAEMVTLASVVEKETGLSDERALISGVFHNRLRLGMRLQSDPTVIYGRGESRGPLTRAELNNPTPYNTYLYQGLPPGPIANPGRAALQAATAPAETQALYFVSRNDGSHEFSDSLEAHNRAVRRHQRGRAGF